MPYLSQHDAFLLSEYREAFNAMYWQVFNLDGDTQRIARVCEAVGLHTYVSWSDIQFAWWKAYPDIEDARAAMYLLKK